MSDRIAQMDQFLAIVAEEEIGAHLDEFTRVASNLAQALHRRGLDDGVIAAALAGHLAKCMVDAAKRAP